MALQYSQRLVAPPLNGAPQLGHLPWKSSSPMRVWTPGLRTKDQTSVKASSGARFAAATASACEAVAGDVRVPHPRAHAHVDGVEPLALLEPDELHVQHLDVGDGVAHALSLHELELHLEALVRGVREEGPHRRHVPLEPGVLQRQEELPRPVEQRLELELGILQAQGVDPPLDVARGDGGALLGLALLEGALGGAGGVQVALVVVPGDHPHADQRQHDVGIAEGEPERSSR